jgi:transcriptional regulator with XRE-family HTH domain
LSSSLETLRSSVGKALRFLRDDAEMSQEEVSEKSGIHPTYISRLEKGKGNPTLRTLESLAKGLGVESADILNLAEVFAKERGGVKR